MALGGFGEDKRGKAGMARKANAGPHVTLRDGFVAERRIMCGGCQISILPGISYMYVLKVWERREEVKVYLKNG
ncbi:hypothetical protein H6P81_004148 [Aristolochia fimbriata]|uniref:Uncharacterized protein n=1 Tax=Aristolochia fimbriata TaxID=158543 RepID=A0AAV7FH57_ARIFI|nr:hypothetical protein H6P81_004148 [Aristolochia fimbriata]